MFENVSHLASLFLFFRVMPRGSCIWVKMIFMLWVLIVFLLTYKGWFVWHFFVNVQGMWHSTWFLRPGMYVTCDVHAFTPTHHTSLPSFPHKCAAQQDTKTANVVNILRWQDSVGTILSSSTREGGSAGTSDKWLDGILFFTAYEWKKGSDCVYRSAIWYHGWIVYS